MFPSPVCKQKPEVRSLPSGLPQNCSSKWTHRPQLWAQQFPRRWHGVTVRTSSPHELFQEHSTLGCGVESRWLGADLVPLTVTSYVRLQMKRRLNLNGTQVPMWTPRKWLPISPWISLIILKACIRMPTVSWITESLKQTQLSGTWVPN